jgi:hypothetical protein
MGFCRKNVLIGLPKITEGGAMFVFIRDGLPSLKTGRFPSISNDEGDDLAGPTAHRCPHPPRLVFCAHTTPHFIKFEHIIWGRRRDVFL